MPDSLWPSLVDDVEGRFRGAAEAIESGRGHNVPNTRLTGLRAQTQSDFLRPRAGRAQQRGKRVVDPANGIQIVLQLIIGKRLDDHPRAILGQRLPDVSSGSNWIAHVMQAVEDGNEIVISAGKFFCF